MATKRKRAAKAPAKKSSSKKVAKNGDLIPEATITILAESNPKRRGTAAYKRFAKYQPGQTVSAALSKGLQRRDLNYDRQHGFIRVA